MVERFRGRGTAPAPVDFRVPPVLQLGSTIDAVAPNADCLAALPIYTTICLPIYLLAFICLFVGLLLFCLSVALLVALRTRGLNIVTASLLIYACKPNRIVFGCDHVVIFFTLFTLHAIFFIFWMRKIGDD